MLEKDIFLVLGYWVFQKKIENQLGFHMRNHLFLHHGWFLQNLGKYFIRTNMHTTVTRLFPRTKKIVNQGVSVFPYTFYSSDTVHYATLHQVLLCFAML